jgi:hypothetical protein
MASNSPNADQNRVPLPPHTKIASKNKSLLHDITSLSNPTKFCESSPLQTDEPYFPNAAINRGLSPSRAGQRSGNELNGFLDDIFSSMSTYQMEFDVEIERLMG